MKNFFEKDDDTIPVFKIGDEIKFQIVKLAASAVPRYEHIDNLDRGDQEPRLWAKGKVSDVDNNYITVQHYHVVDGHIEEAYSCFPNIGHDKYVPWEWSWPGYLQHANKQLEIICECGAEKVYGSQTNTHSDWCGKYYKNV